VSRRTSSTLRPPIPPWALASCTARVAARSIRRP
jgi:hypothetical protein